MFMKVKYTSISAFILLGFSVLLFFLTLSFLAEETVVLLEWNVVQNSSCKMDFMIILDVISLSFSTIVCLISGCVMMFSSSYMSHDLSLGRFSWLVIFFVMSMNLLIFIPSLPALLMGWDGLGIVSFALVIYYQNKKSLNAGMLTVLANRIGDVLILLTIGFLVLEGHWVIVLTWGYPSCAMIVSTVIIAAMTKSAQIPFSAWLPAAMAAPTPVSALVHSSTLVTAGVFLIIRFYDGLSKLNTFKPFLLFGSLLTLFMAANGANYENDLKKVVALSTLSQLGVMMMSLAMGMPYLSLYHLYTHALFKALLFLCAGAIIHISSNTQDIRLMGNIFKQTPLVTSCMNVANLCLCGAPFLSGFYSKDLILEISLTEPMSFFVIMIFFVGTGMTVSYSVRLSLMGLWGLMKNSPNHAKGKLDSSFNCAMAILTMASITFGFFLQLFFLEFDPIPLMMPAFHKSLTSFTILMGALLSFLVWAPDFFIIFMSKSKSFALSMWFLALISAQPLAKQSMLMSSDLMKVLDHGWLQIMGGQGLNSVLVSISQMSQVVQQKVFNFFVSLITGFSFLFAFFSVSWI